MWASWRGATKGSSQLLDPNKRDVSPRFMKPAPDVKSVNLLILSAKSRARGVLNGADCLQVRPISFMSSQRASRRLARPRGAIM